MMLLFLTTIPSFAQERVPTPSEEPLMTKRSQTGALLCWAGLASGLGVAVTGSLATTSLVQLHHDTDQPAWDRDHRRFEREQIAYYSFATVAVGSFSAGQLLLFVDNFGPSIDPVGQTALLRVDGHF